MVRLYGEEPYKVVLVHGGPGAIGSLKGFAEELSELSKVGIVSAIGVRRFKNLSEEDSAVFKRLNRNEAKDEDMKRIPQILEKSDNYCLENKEKHRADKTDSDMHNRVWGEAAKLRTSGELLKCFRNIKSRLYLIQGEYDPHPVNGVTIPLQENGVQCGIYILEKCGHSPFMEKYAKDKFYNIILGIIM